MALYMGNAKIAGDDGGSAAPALTPSKAIVVDFSDIWHDAGSTGIMAESKALQQIPQ